MVHVKDDGVFDAPVDKVWQLLNDQNHHHRSVKSSKVVEQSGKGMTIDAERVASDGSTRMETIKFTFDPPKGFTMEWLSGNMKGSRQTHRYTPMGSKTKVDVEGDILVQGMDDNAVRKAALAMLAEVFEEDSAALKNLK
ncbi:MAG TPA: SRPBCC family protein [Terriglobales bacterium]|nr:SRPBCC family protein [Terriglobales bacterium]